MEDNRNAYSEVIEILKMIDDEEKLEALPMELLEVLKSKMNPEYKPQISKDIPLEEQNLQRETLSILAWISMKYWGDNFNIEEIKSNTNVEESTKETDEHIENENVEPQIDNAENTEINENLNSEINDNNEENTSNSSEALMPTVVKEANWFERLKVKIIEFFNKIFRRNKNDINIEN